MFPHASGRVTVSPLSLGRRRRAVVPLGTAQGWAAPAGSAGTSVGSRPASHTPAPAAGRRSHIGVASDVDPAEAVCWRSLRPQLLGPAKFGSRVAVLRLHSSSRGPWAVACRSLVSSSRALQSGTAAAEHVEGRPSELPPGLSANEVHPPNLAQLKMLGLAAALPFVGFGFLDNFLMILFGDFIDGTLCVRFSLSTMAAAAIGNTISDAAGIFSGGAVEQLATRCGVEEPPMSREQRQMRITKTWLYSGQVIGILIGCTLGCCPLLWLNPEAAIKLKTEKMQSIIFQKATEKVSEMMHAEAAMLMFVDKDKGDLYARNVTKNLHCIRWRMDHGFIGHAARTGKFVNVADVHEEQFYDPKLHDNFMGTGMVIRSLLCMPVWSKGEVLGVICVLNKQEGGAFTNRDEDILSAISTHVAITITDSAHNFDDILENCEKSVNKQGAPQWNTATLQRRKTLFEPVLKGMGHLLEAESTALMLLDEEHGELYTEAIEGSVPKHRVSIGQCFAGWTVERGLVLNKTEEEFKDLFSPEMYNDYQGSGINVESVLCVPIFDTGRKCLGAFEIINKRGAAGSGVEGFVTEDVQYAQQVANYMALLLEGPTAELRRVLALTRQLQQHKVALEASGRCKQSTVVCFLEQGQDLPTTCVTGGNETLDSYVTFHIVRGDPLKDQEPGLQKKMLARRSNTTRQHVWDIGKSTTEFENRNPKWNETMAVPMPKRLEGVPPEELYLHVLLWGFNSIKEDTLLGQAAFPLSRMPRQAARGARPFPLLAIPGQEGHIDVDKARIWLSFSRDWGSETTVPEVIAEVVAVQQSATADGSAAAVRD